MLKVTHLKKSFGNNHVLKDINIELAAGEIVGFVGPNGIGKSTTLKCISGFLFPNGGSISIDGIDLAKNRRKALKPLACQIESPGLYYDMSGKQNVRTVAKLFHIAKDKEEEIIDFINIGEAIHKKASTYSMGMKQRLALGLAIMRSPKLLILDEPTNGLDPTMTKQFKDTILELGHERNMAILFSSHQLDEMSDIADRVIFLKDGIIAKEVSRADRAPSYQLNLEAPHADLAESEEFMLVAEASYATRSQEAFLHAIESLRAAGIPIQSVETKTSHLLDYYNDLYVG